MSLSTIAATLEKFAEEVVGDAVQEGQELGQKLVAIGKEALAEGAEALEEGFEDFVGNFGKHATELVTNLFADDSLSGLEKANLAATQLTEQASLAGIDAAAHWVSALIENSYQTVKAKIASL